ncbi:MAG: BrnA antitoxin family protein [Methylophilaceae bacterium]
MKNESIGKHLGTDLKKLRALPNAGIVIDENSPYDPNDEASVEAFWQNATVRRPGQRGKQKDPVKVPATIRFDADVLAYFKSQGQGWQTRINDVLKAAISQNHK